MTAPEPKIDVVLAVLHSYANGADEFCMVADEALKTIRALRAEHEALRADFEVVRCGEAVHTHECPYWRIGKKRGPCVCGAAEKQEKIDAARARWARTEKKT